MSRYYYKGKPYSILIESQIKMNGIWTDVVIYKCEYDNPGGMIWVRFKDEFYELFKMKENETISGPTENY